MPASTLSSRTHRQSTTGRATCQFARCPTSGSRPQVIKHEVQEHLLRRFFCCACDRTLSSFESLRTHANSQHFRNRRFVCETCHTTYLDPARLAKCRKRHRGQFRCPEAGCIYHNARKNSVVRHLKTQHHRVADDDEIIFDNHLGGVDPPKMRRVGSTSASSVSSLPGAVDSLLVVSSQGPSDDELFRRSEEKRRVVMELTRKEHVQWMGGEDALKAAVPDYPVWTQREHPYGRAPSPEPEQIKDEDETSSARSPTAPALTVSSPRQISGFHTLNNYVPQAAPPSMPITTASSTLLVPSHSLLSPTTSLCTAASATASPWLPGCGSYPDILPTLISSTQPCPLPSPSLHQDPFNVPALESSALFSPNTSASPLSSPADQWLPITPRGEHFVTPSPYDTDNCNPTYDTQYSDSSSSASSSQDSLCFSSDPTFCYLTGAHETQLFQEVKYDGGSQGFMPEWLNVGAES